ncbi:MAG: DNA adenine methylase [Chloroherpetonaceae bacterium]
MLFEQYQYDVFRFPQPQYLGAKYALLNWIAKFIPKGIERAIDGFAGSQSVAFLFKQHGLEVLTNDFLLFNHQIGLALIENSREKLEKSDVDMLLRENPAAGTLMEELFAGVFFEEHEARFLDSFRANVEQLGSDCKKALAFAIMNRSLTRKVIMGHFAHNQALSYAANPARVKRNPSIARPIAEIFKSLVPEYNHAVFDNGKQNRSFNANILELLPHIDRADLIYLDPPYTDSHADYQAFYHLLETFTRAWRDKKFINSTKRYAPPFWSGFDKKTEVLDSFAKLFELASEIPHWLISFNDRSYPSVEELRRLIMRYKEVQVEAKPYVSSRGGKGSVAGSHEVLFVCKNKLKVAVNFPHK